MAKKPKYCEAHPKSEMGDPNFADERGWELVAIRPNGLLIYKRNSILSFFGFSLFGVIIGFRL